MKNIKLLLAIIVSNVLYAQEIKWSKCFGGSAVEGASVIKQTND